MKRAVLTLMIHLFGCGPDVDWQRATYYAVQYDRGCPAPTDDDREHLGRATDLWHEWGIHVHEDVAEGGEVQVALCLSDGPVREGYGGWAYGPNADGHAAILANRAVGARRYYYATIAHEIGHLVLMSGDGDHLPDGELGIMSPGIDCHDGDFECRWSAADADHLESFGLERSM